jgi:hypothetical protein
LEADDSEGFTGTTDPDWIPAYPTALFAPTTPVLWISKVDGVDVTREPVAGLRTVEVEIDDANPVTVEVEAIGVKPGTQVTIHITQAYGGRYSVTSSGGLEDKDGVLSVKIENVTIPPGRCEIQLRANWTP